jgi:hypothetical protein
VCRAWKKIPQYATQIWEEILCIVAQSNSSFGPNVQGVIKKYGECLNKKNYYSEKKIAIIPHKIPPPPPRFVHTYPIILATF